MYLLAWLFVIGITRQVTSHGWLDLPVARSSAWLYNNKYNSSFPINYMHTQMNCGGFEILEQNSNFFIKENSIYERFFILIY